MTLPKAAIERRLEGLVDGVRIATRYEGDDHAFLEWASDRAWDVKTYQDIGYYSGGLESLLGLAEALGVPLSLRIVDRARAYIYTT